MVLKGSSVPAAQFSDKELVDGAIPSFPTNGIIAQRLSGALSMQRLAVRIRLVPQMSINFMRILGTKDQEFFSFIESKFDFWKMNPHLEEKWKSKDVKEIIKWCKKYLEDEISCNKK